MYPLGDLPGLELSQSQYWTPQHLRFHNSNLSDKKTMILWITQDNRANNFKFIGVLQGRKKFAFF